MIARPFRDNQQGVPSAARRGELLLQHGALGLAAFCSGRFSWRIPGHRCSRRWPRLNFSCIAQRSRPLPQTPFFGRGGRSPRASAAICGPKFLAADSRFPTVITARPSLGIPKLKSNGVKAKGQPIRVNSNVQYQNMTKFCQFLFIYE